MIKLIISWLNVSFKKLIVWLQLHPKLIASDYITTGRPLGRTKGVHSCVTPQGALSGGCEAWLANPSSLTYFNTNGRVSGLGETSWYALSKQRPRQISVGESTNAKPRQNTTVRTVNIIVGVYRTPVSFNRIICAPIWHILCNWYGMRMFTLFTTQVTDIVGSTPLWKSIRIFFHTMFYHLFFVVCSSFHT